MNKGIDWAKAGADLLTNPAKVWNALVKPVLGKVARGVGSSAMGRAVAKYPVRMVGSLRDSIVDAATGMFSGDGGGGGALGNGQWVRPVNAPLGTPFGKPGSMWSSGYHTGLDFPAPTGTPIRAVDAGRVTQATGGGPYGNHVMINHGGGLSSLYAHLSRIMTSVGAVVARGQKTGAVGATGNVTGPHLHLEARRGGRTVNPAPYLFDDGGYLPPGLSLVANGTSKPEPILTSGQWDDIRASRAADRRRASPSTTGSIWTGGKSAGSSTSALTCATPTPDARSTTAASSDAHTMHTPADVAMTSASPRPAD